MHINIHNILKRWTAVLGTGALIIALGACGSTNDDHKNNTNALTEMTGITATGKLGEKPTISFKKPFKVQNNTYEVVQKGDGPQLKDGQQLCIHQIMLDPQSGKVLNSTWDTKPYCESVLSKGAMNPNFYNLFKTLNVHSTVVMGIADLGGNPSSKDNKKEPIGYLMALTIASAKDLPTRASGKKVTDIDPSLPKITLDNSGKPSVNADDLKNYKSDGTLKSQVLIEGNGPVVTEHSTVTVQYTGWTLGGDANKPFDSSWNRGAAATFSLQSVVKGWTQGLAGKKVGSQVLLIVPPSYGYGDAAQGGIPANSTLVFVVDILAAQ